ncbi:reverse transcriptase domain-containing protein [Tanacetum coccineum]
MLLMDGCFGKWGTNQNDGSALGIGDETPLSIPFGTTLCSSDGKATTSIRKFYFVGTCDTRECLDTSFTVVGGSILRSARIAIMEAKIVSFRPELWLGDSLSKFTEKVKGFANWLCLFATIFKQNQISDLKKNQICELRNILVATYVREEEIRDGAVTMITPNLVSVFINVSVRARYWRHPWDPTLRTLPKSRMTKQGNFTQRTPQAKKQSDQASRQISKQASGSNAPPDLVFTAMGPPLGTIQTTATITSTEGADNLTLEGVATELAPSDFVSQNYETLVALMQEETKKRSSQSLQARLNFGPEDEVSPPRHQKERRGKDNRRPPVFGRIGKKVSGTQTANLQNLDTHENNDWRISVRDRLGSRDVHSRLGQRRSPSESPPSSDSEDSRRKRRRRVSSSSEDSSDNEDAETGHWKSKNKYREDEDEDMSRPWRRQKVDAFTRRISDFSEDKKRRMPANVKTYDGTGDPDDHLKIFESAATIENWPQPVWCHMFNSTLVGNARNWFSKLPRRSIDGFEELRRAFRLNFTQRKKCAKNPVELARVKQRQGESTSAYVERYKDECIHVKACPEILKISGFMNGINNPELIKRLNDRVPQTFDELMKRTRSFIQGEAAAADSRKGYSNNRSQEQSRRQSNDQSSSRNNSYRGQRGGRGNDKYTPLTMTPKEILATEGSNFPKPPPMRTPEEQRVGNGYCEYHRQKGHTTNECVQLRQLIDKLVKEGRLDHLVKNIKEGKDKQRSGGKKDAPRDKADTIYMVQS